MGELAATFDRLIQHLQESFEAQKRFVADASHDLRSPLTVIQGNIDLLKRNRREEREESLKAIESETGRMSKLVQNLLFLAELESGHAEKLGDVNLTAIVSEELKRAEQLAGGRRITVGRIADLKIKGDSFRLRQMLGNLLDNAVRYTPENGSISLSLSRDGQYARLEVSDSGTGIPREHLPHLFERFYRVDKARSRERGSTGLGLAIVKSVAEQHGGRVSARSELGKGSAFTVWLKI